MANKFTKTELAAVRDPADSAREIEDVSDLTFGEYVRLLQNPKHWATLAIQIDRKTFTDELRKVGEIRNDVMSFSPRRRRSRRLDQAEEVRTLPERYAKEASHVKAKRDPTRRT